MCIIFINFFDLHAASKSTWKIALRHTCYKYAQDQSLGRQTDFLPEPVTPFFC
jgi:hypothetical protein